MKSPAFYLTPVLKSTFKYIVDICRRILPKYRHMSFDIVQKTQLSRLVKRV